ncbi:DUF4286 family protein [Sphingobacterium cellulitidis]|uniref:DUF4286 domain-containing protein n=1 Tax=Sphingobacterium cellulitidis TaxID=1768011 RepID=A0A8H9G1C9_9SPHI|nr:DUF4286 family protein [Sphingobacterium soli]MBA8987749.1 hypothetical protein [Sphingobacterium soli]GGE22715.1 hypothetical protein GCM10011516_20500 [Sphingobacterium soli]
MFLYNVSIIIEDSVHQELINWTKGLLNENPDYAIKLLKMLHSPHEGQTYCLQTILNSKEEIEMIKEQVIQKLQDYISTHHVEKAFLFDSIMQYIPHN